MKKTSIIVAVAENNVIGKNNQLIWHLPADLKHFKTITMGSPIIMGRKTYESIGKALPGRTNIIITRNNSFFADGCTITNSLEQAIELAPASNELFIIGGEEIFKMALSLASKIYLTKIHHAFDGDTYFPEIENSTWKIAKKEDFIADEKNAYSYSFIEYERI